MRVIKGQLKLQHGIFYVHEMLEFKSVRSDPIEGIVGYAIFDLQHQRIGRFCKFYHEVMIEVAQLSKNDHIHTVLLAA